MTKPVIGIPLIGESEKIKSKSIKLLSDDYDNFTFVESKSDKFEFPKIDSKDDIFVIVVNVQGIIANLKEDLKIIMSKYKDKYEDLELIFLPSQNEPSTVICLTNSSKEVELLF